MADDNWKTRVGIEINFSSDDEDTGGTTKFGDDITSTLSPLSHDSPDSSFEGQRFFGDDILNEYADYGSTPPRTRISRRLREHKQRAGEMSSTKSAAKVIHAKATRRNTLDSLYFSELLERSDLSSPQHQTGSALDQPLRPESGRRSNSKRSMKLLRGSERDLKLDIPGATRPVGTGLEAIDDRAESLPVMIPQLTTFKVETCNRFLSLTSKLVACRAFRRLEKTNSVGECSQTRVDFYDTFSRLIRMGNGEKQNEKNPKRLLSREEHLWQNELKDLIWLELQAFHAGMTLTEQDAHLCKAREEIEPLLNDIMVYRFIRQKADTEPSPSPSPSAHSQDSGISPDQMCDSHILCCTAKFATCTHNQSTTHHLCPSHHGHAPSCDGCLSMYCHDCNHAQETALREIEAMLDRLDAAEALYPSSKAFAVQYPLIKSAGFVGRVKAMCLWLNMTKHSRLKLRILGKLLMWSVFHDKQYRWPSFVDEEGSSGIGSDTPGSDAPSSDSNVSRSSSVEGRHRKVGIKPSVQFDVDSSSPSSSNNSNASHGTTSSEAEVSDHLRELYNLKSLSNPGPPVFNSHHTKNPYRKYIEEVLKTRGLRKALSFLESLHTRVLLKSLITLENPAEKSLDDSVGDSNKLSESTDTIQDSLTNDFLSIGESESDEMRRYGYWSPETRALSLPSYRSAFLFLSRIPLDVIHEFLSMRLEQKPDQPSVLSIRQLMRELKEGLGIAALHRERYLQLIRKVLWDVEPAVLEQFENGVDDFDKSVKLVFEVYLDYLQQWVQMVQQESFRKHLLEEEWKFVRATCPHISDGDAMAGNSFCHMASSILAAVGELLLSSVEQVKSNMDHCEQSDEESTPRQCLLSVCRDLQGMLNVARVRALKAICFAKMIQKDLEGNGSQHVDPTVGESVKQLKVEGLGLSYSIVLVIREIDGMCDFRHWCDLDETDRSAVVSRCREVLHLAFKFGFEYHKEVCRLVTGGQREKLSRGLIGFAKLWMTFVGERCERGRGIRPRWANQGLDFLMTICEPHHTNFLSDVEFEALKSAMDQCISHVIGQPPATPDKPPSPLPPSPRASIDYSRSPLPIRAKLRNSRSLCGHRRTPSGNVVIDDCVDGNIAETLLVPMLALTREDRVTAAVSSLDDEIDDRLRSRDLIGSVTDVESKDKIHIRLRSVTFGWQRGIKIGQGSYGKVYTAVNNQTGELMAMKEIQLQPNDHRTIRRVAEELRIFEGIKHEHLVRYYGVEIHREEMLIFMEFCAEGTLESLVAGTEAGLPEALIRRFTRQLLLAVSTLHRHGVVHRDVKSANIFLTDLGNCLKLGDFGSAVKIKAHTTLPGELQGFVGTQAYMAPEVFMKTTSEGHGRAADVWSIGCVVVEMASGERPWAEFDSNYQIMFKVGMGETPTFPDTLSEEGVDFLGQCFQHDPKTRAAAETLLQHTFSKVDGDEENVLSLPM